jgi:ribosomal protein L34
LKAIEMQPTPARIQRKRTKGFNLQAASPNGLPVVSVCRPGKWGNPHKISDHDGDVSEVVRMDKVDLVNLVLKDKNGTPLFYQLNELKGKNLACFCGLDQPCHADPLIRLANQ